MRIPSYRKHVSGQACVTLGGKDLYASHPAEKFGAAEFKAVKQHWLSDAQRRSALSTAHQQVH